MKNIATQESLEKHCDSGITCKTLTQESLVKYSDSVITSKTFQYIREDVSSITEGFNLKALRSYEALPSIQHRELFEHAFSNKQDRNNRNARASYDCTIKFTLENLKTGS